MVAKQAMQYTDTLNATALDMTPTASLSKISPKPAFFSIWMATIRVFFRRIGPLLGFTLAVAAPFFLINGGLHAHHMMTLGGASLNQIEIPADQMRMLWLSLALGDAVSFVALALVALLMAMRLVSDKPIAVLQVLGRALRSISFWLFALGQIVVFALVNSGDGRLKIGGMVLYALSVLFFLAIQDRDAPAYGKRLSQLRWTGWLSIILVLAIFPVLFILLNGIVDYIMLMYMDQAAAMLLNLFPPGSPILPYGTITLTKFLSQWLNLLPTTLLLCTYLSLRERSAALE
jgi:hypothetical protein